MVASVTFALVNGKLGSRVKARPTPPYKVTVSTSRISCGREGPTVIGNSIWKAVLVVPDGTVSVVEDKVGVGFSRGGAAYRKDVFE